MGQQAKPVSPGKVVVKTVCVRACLCVFPDSVQQTARLVIRCGWWRVEHIPASLAARALPTPDRRTFARATARASTTTTPIKSVNICYLSAFIAGVQFHSRWTPSSRGVCDLVLDVQKWSGSGRLVDFNSSSRGSVVKALDANLSLSPLSSTPNRWWRSEGNPAKIAPLYTKKSNHFHVGRSELS